MGSTSLGIASTPAFKIQFLHKLKSTQVRVWLVVNNDLIPIGYGCCALQVASAFMLERSGMYCGGVLLDGILAEKAQDVKYEKN